MLRGLPASGKSTFALELVKNGNNWCRVNKDDIRLEYPQFSEKEVVSFEDEQIIRALEDGMNVVVDDTNFNPFHEKRLRDIADKYLNSSEFEIKDFNTPLDECIKRDSLRDKSVGEKVIRDMHNKYLNKSTKIEYNPNLPDAYIFDIDGTLAINNNGRSPYDYTKVHLDDVNKDVLRIYKYIMWEGVTRFIVSGRDDGCMEVTKKWFEDKQIPHDGIFMRKTGDKRKDAIVKKEIFDNNFRGKYNIIGVFDDRQQVVDMWREIGLTCFQVAPGNF